MLTGLTVITRFTPPGGPVYWDMLSVMPVCNERVFDLLGLTGEDKAQKKEYHIQRQLIADAIQMLRFKEKLWPLELRFLLDIYINSSAGDMVLVRLS